MRIIKDGSNTSIKIFVKRDNKPIYEYSCRNCSARTIGINPNKTLITCKKCGVEWHSVKKDI